MVANRLFNLGRNDNETYHSFRSVILPSLAASPPRGQRLAASQNRSSRSRRPRVTNPALVELGQKLPISIRAPSKSGFISCNSCHNLSMAAPDNIPTPIGDKWQQADQPPTVLNSSLNLAQFWDGRAADHEQAGGPIANPGEMVFSHTLAVDAAIDPRARRRLQESLWQRQGRYRQGHQSHRRLRGRNPPGHPEFTLDKWLKGDKKAAGARMNWKATNCSRTAVVLLATTARLSVAIPSRKWGGRNCTRLPPRLKAVGGDRHDADRFNFKVPTLRNVEMTHPYFQRRSSQYPEGSQDIMGRLQLGKKFSDDENASHVAFLKTLTGDQPNFKMPDRHCRPTARCARRYLEKK